MPQRDGAPPEQWQERKDRDTRRAFERFEEKLRGEFHAELDDHRRDADRRLKGFEDHYVSYKSFTFGLLAMVGAVIGISITLMGPTKEAAVAASAKVDRVEAVVSQRLNEQEKEIERIRADINAVLRVTVDGKPRKQVQREWENATGVPRVDAAP